MSIISLCVIMVHKMFLSLLSSSYDKPETTRDQRTLTWR